MHLCHLVPFPFWRWSLWSSFRWKFQVNLVLCDKGSISYQVKPPAVGWVTPISGDLAIGKPQGTGMAPWGGKSSTIPLIFTNQVWDQQTLTVIDGHKKNYCIQYVKTFRLRKWQTMNATKRATLDCFCPNPTINFSFWLATSIAHSKTWASPFWWDCWVVRAAGSNAGLWQLLYLRPGRRGAPWVSSNQSDPGMENKVPCPTTHHSTVHWIVAVLLFDNTEKI